MTSRKIEVIDGVWEHVVKQLSNSKELVLPGDIDSYIGNEGVFMIIQRFSYEFITFLQTFIELSNCGKQCTYRRSTICL